MVADPDCVISIIRDKLDRADEDDVDSTCAQQCIFKVPMYLREGNDMSFTPQIVSIGPYHHGREELKSMDRHKWRFLRQVLKRTKHDVKIYVIALKEVEDRIRSYYEGLIDYGSDEFVEMVLLDGCFILELFQGYEDKFEDLGYPKYDPIFTKYGSIMDNIRRDLIMLENQLPFFVLDLLLGIHLRQPKEPEQEGLVSELARRFFKPLIPSNDPPRISYNAAKFDPYFDNGDYLHCIEVFYRGLFWDQLWRKPRSGRINVQSHSNRVADKRQQLKLIHSVTKLREAGIKFQPHQSIIFWDVEFQNGILKIPLLEINDSAEPFFFNLIAFEHCRTEFDSDITSYVIFISNLLNSPEDVRYLRNCGIIYSSWWSDADVVDLFNRLCHGVVLDKFESYLHPLSLKVNEYCDHERHYWLPKLKKNYFSNPWTIISLLAAVILLSATIAQTFYTIYGYYRPLA